MATRDNSKQPKGRSNADDALIPLLAAGVKYEDIAVQADVSVSTICRRLRSPAFVARIEQAREDFLGRALGMLAEASVRASAKLASLMDAAPEQVQLGAAKAVLEQVVRVREHVHLSARMAALEERIAMVNAPPAAPVIDK